MSKLKSKTIFIFALMVFSIFATTNVSAMSVEKFEKNNFSNINNESKEMVEGTLDERTRSTSLPTTALYQSRQIIFKPISHKSIFEEYSKTNKTHKGIYGLYLYYCYLLGGISKEASKTISSLFYKTRNKKVR